MNDTVSAFFSTDSLLIGTIIPFLFVLTIVVFVHEMGHYLVGRWCGIGVKAFSIGFGPEKLGEHKGILRHPDELGHRRRIISGKIGSVAERR